MAHEREQFDQIRHDSHLQKLEHVRSVQLSKQNAKSPFPHEGRRNSEAKDNKRTERWCREASASPDKLSSSDRSQVGSIGNTGTIFKPTTASRKQSNSVLSRMEKENRKEREIEMLLRYARGKIQPDPIQSNPNQMKNHTSWKISSVSGVFKPRHNEVTIQHD